MPKKDNDISGSTWKVVFIVLILYDEIRVILWLEWTIGVAKFGNAHVGL